MKPAADLCRRPFDAATMILDRSVNEPNQPYGDQTSDDGGGEDDLTVRWTRASSGGVVDPQRHGAHKDDEAEHHDHDAPAGEFGFGHEVISTNHCVGVQDGAVRQQVERSRRASPLAGASH